jgi:hypothetical protein
MVGIGALLLLFSLWLGVRLVSGWAAPLGASGALHLQIIDGLLFAFALLGIIVGMRFFRRQTIPFPLFLGLLGLVGALFLAALSTSAALKEVASQGRPVPAPDSSR